MWILYFLGIKIYGLAVRVASYWSPKARKWVEGRVNIFETIDKSIPEHSLKIWMHCASLGEFEQGRPIIEELRKEKPEAYIIITFYSPSGYEVRKNYPSGDLIVYLPEDLPGNAHKFIRMIEPSLAIFVKYEFWAGYLIELKKQNIPSILISARFRQDQFLFNPVLGKWILNKLNAFDKIHVQDDSSKILLKNRGFNHIKVSGDTRFDRVSKHAQSPENIDVIANWLGENQALVAGSTWEDDDKVLLPWESTRKLIIAPHEISESRIKSIEDLCGKASVRYTDLIDNPSLAVGKDILILNTIGILMSVYQYGKVAYVGGGFHKALHNILEPASMGLPVLFGPENSKFPEAKDLEKFGGGFEINNREDFYSKMNFLFENKDAGRQSLKFVSSQKGATAIIMEDIRTLLTDRK